MECANRCPGRRKDIECKGTIELLLGGKVAWAAREGRLILDRAPFVI